MSRMKNFSRDSLERLATQHKNPQLDLRLEARSVQFSFESRVRKFCDSERCNDLSNAQYNLSNGQNQDHRSEPTPIRFSISVSQEVMPNAKRRNDNKT